MSSESLDDETSSQPSSPNPPATATSGKRSNLMKKFKLDDETLSAPGTPPKNELQSWQETKVTIKERTSCLLNSERLSDILFLVGPNETPIYGHKTILSAGSPYFEKLFYGPMATVESTLRIPDIEHDVFLGFLKYLYTDEFDQSMGDVYTMHLLQPAKVYLVPHLAEKCIELLIEKIDPDNVLIIYKKALIFDETRLAVLCLRFLDRQIDQVIETEAFLDIDLETLSTLLERQNLRIDEASLFNGVMMWAAYECERQGLEPTSPNCRKVLGESLYLIRFPTMTQEEFCIDVVPKEILTESETIGVFMNMCIGEEMRSHRPETPFSMEKRVFKPKLHYLHRFSDVLSKVVHLNNLSCAHPGTGHNDGRDVIYSCKLKFRSDQRIFLHGLGVYGISTSIPSMGFISTISVSKGQTALTTKTANGNSRNYDFRIPFHVLFDKPVEIFSNEEYLLQAVLKVVRDTSLPLFGGSFGPNSFAQPSVDSHYGSKAKSVLRKICEDGAVVNLTFITPSAFQFGDVFSLGIVENSYKAIVNLLLQAVFA